MILSAPFYFALNAYKRFAVTKTLNNEKSNLSVPLV